MYRHGNTWFDPVSLEVSVGRMPPSSEGPPPPVPEPDVSAIQAVVTRRCNLNCDYCNVRLSGDRELTMSSPVVDSVIRAAGDAPAGRLVMVTGGEPLLVPDITLGILSSIEPPSVLFTNATLMNHDLALKIRDTGAAPVVSLDGMKESHDRNRCGSFEAAARGLDSLRDSGVPFGISTVVNRANLRDFDGEMEAILDRFQPVSIGCNILHWTPAGFDPVTGEEYAGTIEMVFRTALRRGIFIDQIARRLTPVITGKYRHRDCAAMGGKVVFHPDGAVSNCISSRVMADWSGRIPAFMDQCGNCHAAGICGGGCAWDGVHLGTRGGPDPRHCLWTKRVLDLFLEDIEMNFLPGPVPREMLRKRYGPLISRGTSTLNSSIGHGGK